MGAAPWILIAVILTFIPVCIPLLWTTSTTLPNNFTLAACVGQDVTLAWAYNIDANETVVDAEWLFRPNDSSAEEIIATGVRGHFFLEPGLNHNMQYLPNAGIRLQGVSASDSGTYTVRVNVHVNGVYLVSHVQSVNVDVTATSITTNGQLQAHLEGAQYLSTTRQHHLLLTCGIFNPLWIPRVNVFWTTPMNQTLASSFQENGHFVLAVPNPFVSGEYTCRINNSSPAFLCITMESPLARGATVMVDGTEGRIALMASQLQTTQTALQVLQNENANLTNHVSLLEVQSHNLQNQNANLTSHVSTLELQTHNLQNQNANLTSHISSCEVENANLTHDVSTLRSTVHQLQTENANLTQHLRDFPDEAYSPLRLVGGSNANEGRVEIRIKGVWGTVCDDYWDVNDATVVCGQLGLPTGSPTPYDLAHFGQGSGPIHLGGMNCVGTESNLLDCPRYIALDPSGCTHVEDAGIHCA